MSQLAVRPPSDSGWWTLDEPSPVAAVGGLSGTPDTGLSRAKPSRGQLTLRAWGPDGRPVAPPPWLLPVERALQELFELPAGWDGRLAARVSEVAVAGCVEVLSRTMAEHSPAPQLVPLPDGGLQAEWHADGHDVEIEITGTGAVHAFAGEPDGTVRLDEEWDGVFDEQQGAVLQEALNRLTELVRTAQSLT